MVFLRDFQVFFRSDVLSQAWQRAQNIAAFPYYEAVRLDLKAARLDAPWAKILVSIDVRLVGDPEDLHFCRENGGILEIHWGGADVVFKTCTAELMQRLSSIIKRVVPRPYGELLGSSLANAASREVPLDHKVPGSIISLPSGGSAWLHMVGCCGSTELYVVQESSLGNVARDKVLNVGGPWFIEDALKPKALRITRGEIVVDGKRGIIGRARLVASEN